MNITKATYGGVDCTAQVKAKAKEDRLIIRANNDIIGDPLMGQRKTLIVEVDGKTLSAEEGYLLVYPQSNKDRLGIFYSNNTNHVINPAIVASLKSIEKAAKDKADILTCMWRNEPQNPFPEYIAWTQTQSHLNQLLQVMQLLYVAKDIHDYKYVSFLEHDVLYPEGYFDYPDVESGHVLANMNYMGICKDGFQGVPTKHEPFHQMTMRFDEAIAHCESILANALVTNSGLIEPQVPNVVRTQWDCPNPSVHINHGHHFTSHYSIYSSTDLSKTDPYWGNHDDYMYLF
jgi:hypothetical protein